jgi:hypothetical protein
MATFSKIPLSGSTDGRGIHIDDDATAGKTVHTGSATATTIDEVWLYAQTMIPLTANSPLSGVAQLLVATLLSTLLKQKTVCI